MAKYLIKKNLTSLDDLDLPDKVIARNNDITHIPLCNIVYLDLSNNSIYKLSNELFKNHNLRYLFLRNNKLIYIQNEILNMKLTQLDLRGNPITEAPFHHTKGNIKNIMIDVPEYFFKSYAITDDYVNDEKPVGEYDVEDEDDIVIVNEKT